MRKSILILLLAAFGLHAQAVIVSGTVLLENQNQHEGILIEFTATSPTARDAVAYTDEQGNYSVDIEIGAYDVKFEKDGYRTQNLEGEFVGEDRVIGTTLLSTSTVVDVEVSGEVSGTWADTNRYLITGDIQVVSPGLRIEPGTEVVFMGPYNFYVTANSQFHGLNNEPIVITSSGENNRFVYINVGFATLDMKHVIVEKGGRNTGSPADDFMVTAYDGVLKMDSCIIRQSQGGLVELFQAPPTGHSITNCELYDSPDVGFRTHNQSFVFANNEVYDVYHGVMTSNSSHPLSLVTRNYIHDAYIGLSANGNIEVAENILSQHTVGISASSSESSILNNTIYECNTGMSAVSGEVRNNIIVGSANRGIIPSADIDLFSHNLFYDNIDDISNGPAGSGFIIGQESNGADHDTYFNLFADPEFLSTDPTSDEFLEISIASPAYRMGDPNDLNDQNQRKNIGHDQDASIIESIFGSENTLDAEVWPTVVEDGKLNVRVDNARISILDLNGVIVQEELISGLEQINLSHLTKGMFYYLIVENSSALSSSGKITIK